MTRTLFCPKCNHDHVHLEMTISFKDDDRYQTTRIDVNEEPFLDISMRYEFRSQGNTHLVFSCEGCLGYFIQSFDGHKGMMYLNDNPITHKLEEYLNEQQKKLNEKEGYEYHSLDLKKECRHFFIERAKAEEEEKKQRKKIVYLKNNNGLPF